MDLAYLMSIGIDVVNAKGSSAGACAAGCPSDQAVAEGAARVAPPSAGPQMPAKPSKKAKNQMSNGAAKQSEDDAAKAARAAAKAGKLREKGISQSLSMLLRHRAREVGVRIDSAGWIIIQDALAWMNSFEGDDAIEGPPVTEEEVRAVVSASDKQRFQLRDGPQPQIRASQGHSMPGIDLDLEPLTSAEVPMAVHGTYHAAWEQIQRTGLRRLERNHIHLAQDLPGASGVISGMRSSCEVLIWVDVCRCETAGISFYRSANGVILTEGIGGVIEPQLFARVVDRRTGADLNAR